jgi:hypothetical protein
VHVGQDTFEPGEQRRTSALPDSEGCLDSPMIGRRSHLSLERKVNWQVLKVFSVFNAWTQRKGIFQ